MRGTKILLVDGDQAVRHTLTSVLQGHGFEVAVAASVLEALRLISSDTYDILLCDLHLPDTDDGMVVINAMRFAQPKAVRMLLSAFPDVTRATKDMMLLADHILVKPMDSAGIVRAIEDRLIKASRPDRVIDSLATILEGAIETTVDAWLERVENNNKLRVIAMTHQQRAGHLPQVLLDLARRLRTAGSMGNGEHVSFAAEKHGRVRRRQGYTAAMLVEESRMLQVSIFETLQNNLATIDFSILLNGVMTIADEVDSQLSQAMDAYVEEALREARSAS